MSVHELTKEKTVVDNETDIVILQKNAWPRVFKFLCTELLLERRGCAHTLTEEDSLPYGQAEETTWGSLVPEPGEKTVLLMKNIFSKPIILTLKPGEQLKYLCEGECDTLRI